MPRLDFDVPDRQDHEEDATDKQKAYIMALCREVGGSVPAATMDELGKWQASSVIDELLSFKAELAGRKPLDTSRLTELDSDSLPSRSWGVWELSAQAKFFVVVLGFVLFVVFMRML